MSNSKSDGHGPFRTLERVAAILAIAGVLILAGSAGAAAQEDSGVSRVVRPEISINNPVEQPVPVVAESPVDSPSRIVVPTIQEQGDGGDTDISIAVSEDGGLSQAVVIILMLTVLSVAPGLLLLTTSFTRFAIVLGLTRNAIGSQQIPPTQVLVGLAMVLTVFVMGPVFSEVNEQAIQPLLNGEISSDEAFDLGFAPLRDYMLAQTDDDDVALFMGMSGAEKPETPDELSAGTLIPAFVVSELRTAFMIGFVIFVPFLVIDLIVAAVLMSMGMMMLPPVFISLPLKILLFVLVDGWALIIGSVVSSVNGVA